MPAIPWRDAWQDGLYGPAGFYRRPEGPAGHFRTSAHVPLFAEAITRLAADLDAGLGAPEDFTVVDVGAGRGELLAGLAELTPARWSLVGVEVVDRPAGLDPRVEWCSEAPSTVTGLLLANELLDVVPCPIVARDEDGVVRIVLVDPTSGVEEVGPEAPAADRSWLDTWWPLEPGERAEVGHPRDRVWRGLVDRLVAGAALAVDYSHTVDDRGYGRWPRGTLIGHRRGRVVPPVPDGSCDLTAHVALDSCAAAAADGVDLTLLTSQRESLAALGVSAALPDPTTAATDPQRYAQALQRAGQARELTDPDGLGGFGWLLQGRGLSPAAPAPG